MGVLADEKCDISCQHALAAQKANHILGFIKRGMARRLRDVILSLYTREYPPGVFYSSSGTSSVKWTWTWSSDSRGGPQR